jgi:hypothetical protein
VLDPTVIVAPPPKLSLSSLNWNILDVSKVSTFDLLFVSPDVWVSTYTFPPKFTNLKQVRLLDLIYSSEKRLSLLSLVLREFLIPTYSLR